uniref:Uncharacterized protein MANES_17G073300 n=1 Tax=Rhizophora mucronata TaxID=61149 RepID=A0A2P2JV67_RHIMU
MIQQDKSALILGSPQPMDLASPSWPCKHPKHTDDAVANKYGSSALTSSFLVSTTMPLMWAECASSMR